MISRDTEDALLWHPRSICQLVKEALDQLVLFFLSGVREITGSENEIESQTLRAPLPNRVCHGTQYYILRPRISLPHVDI